jgi:hypothetical protein
MAALIGMSAAKAACLNGTKLKLAVVNSNRENNLRRFIVSVFPAQAFPWFSFLISAVPSLQPRGECSRDQSAI